MREAYWIICLFSFLGFFCVQKSKINIPAYDPKLSLELGYKRDLDHCIQYLDSIHSASSPDGKVAAYLKARRAFKRAEPILAFTDAQNYKSLNAPNILRVDEEDKTSIKIRSPFGFQVMEEQLADEELMPGELEQNIELTISRLKMIRANISLSLKPYHVLWIVRDAVIRTATMGITGFDSPVMAHSLEDAQHVYTRLGEMLDAYADHFRDETLKTQWKEELNNSISDLKGDFNSFDRFTFIRDHTHVQMDLFTKTVTDWNVTFPFDLAILNSATNLFSSGTFNPDYFGEQTKAMAFSPAKAAIGEMLFNDMRLSSKGDMSCATCHQPQLGFTDGKRFFPGQTRNTPSVMYASLQQGFFYDNREGSLEGQIVDVVHHAKEFHTSLEEIHQTVMSDPEYTLKLEKEYGHLSDDYPIRNALAHYIRSLTPFNSRFDQSIRKDTMQLNREEILGFNVFMGKGKCATCHFPPVFNGTVPPAYLESEVEHIGVPADQSAHPVMDPDPGRFNVFGTEERQHFFKTTTVRNVSRTAPYMHNGVFPDLESVVTFYNRGGGAGLGIDSEFQTLPFDSLMLTPEEEATLVAFMKSLEDPLPDYPEE